jgi:hypothetical protein
MTIGTMFTAPPSPTSPRKENNVSEMTPDQKQHRRDMEYRRELRLWLDQWVRLLKQSGHYLWDERDSLALKNIHALINNAVAEKGDSHA